MRAAAAVAGLPGGMGEVSGDAGKIGVEQQRSLVKIEPARLEHRAAEDLFAAEGDVTDAGRLQPLQAEPSR